MAWFSNYLALPPQVYMLYLTIHIKSQLQSAVKDIGSQLHFTTDRQLHWFCGTFDYSTTRTISIESILFESKWTALSHKLRIPTRIITVIPCRPKTRQFQTIGPWNNAKFYHCRKRKKCIAGFQFDLGGSAVNESNLLVLLRPPQTWKPRGSIRHYSSNLHQGYWSKPLCAVRFWYLRFPYCRQAESWLWQFERIHVHVRWRIFRARGCLLGTHHNSKRAKRTLQHVQRVFLPDNTSSFKSQPEPHFHPWKQTESLHGAQEILFAVSARSFHLPGNVALGAIFPGADFGMTRQ